MEEIHKEIEDTVKNHPIVMFVKGSPQMPMCGFSKGVMEMFTELGVDFQTVDVLSVPGVRDGIKSYTQWPTIPQVFLKGEFIGGFDIVREMYEKGELQTMVAELKK